MADKFIFCQKCLFEITERMDPPCSTCTTGEYYEETDYYKDILDKEIPCTGMERKYNP